tara:strand:- start:3558 stop:4520 length:963 start_codon:yes stop_codon:yes gene_type:complete
MNWYEPESIWSNFDIANRDEFVKRYVVSGKFHKHVPEDIVKSFETVTYLLAHSYYHYPMFDEAMNKALLTLEMAIKIKAQALKIDLKTLPNKKNITRNKNLASLINEICEIPAFAFLKVNLDRARDFRNERMHPDKYQLSGIVGAPSINIMLFVNVINKMFLEKPILSKIQNSQISLDSSLAHLVHGGLFLLEHDDNKYAVNKIIEGRYNTDGVNEIYLLWVNVLSHNIEYDIKNYCFDPYVIALKDLITCPEGLMGKDFNDNEVTLSATNHPECIKILKNYKQQKSNVKFDDLNFYLMNLERHAFWTYEQLIYDHLWHY